VRPITDGLILNRQARLTADITSRSPPNKSMTKPRNTDPMGKMKSMILPDIGGRYSTKAVLV